VIIYLSSIQINGFRYRILPTLKGQLPNLIFTLKSTTRKFKNETLRRAWWFHFSNSQLPIHQYRYSSAA